MDDNIIQYQEKLAELVEQLPLDGEVQEKFAGDMVGGLLAGRVCVDTMDDLSGVPIVQQSHQFLDEMVG